ncbi:lysozyme family protein [Halobacillus sp. SY10]|uniref:Lysozyme-like n=2 Tax=Halobacillus TaxID=45667 RepID=A0A1H0FK65_HALAD|nr:MULTISPECIES: lysozyme family protein [Halobacillus]SDN95168.1 Lysozyme-like [Halobacillus aidingensis]
MNKKNHRNKNRSWGAFLLPIFLLGLVFFTMKSQLGDGIMSSWTTVEESEPDLPQQVLQYEDEIETYAEQEGIGEYKDILLALMMQESGGRGDDPMQASESHCGEVGCIGNPELSIEQGVAYFAKTLERSDGDVKLALQSYNFGAGFIDFVMNNGGKYTQDLAIEFSSKKYEELKHTGKYSCIREEAEQYDACYGDIYYVDAVLDHYEEDGDLIASSS